MNAIKVIYCYVVRCFIRVCHFVLLESSIEVDEIDSIFFVYNVKMRKNQRDMSFTETEINVKLSLVSVFFRMSQIVILGCLVNKLILL